MSEKNVKNIMSELAKYNSLADEIAGVIEGLKDQLKEYMLTNNLETLASDEHKATYKAVTSNRLDTTAIKKELPDVAKRYLITTETMRFNFS